MRAMETPPDFREGDDLLEKQGAMKRTQRAILQKFNIRVIVYPERVEIKGTIPTQILDKTNKKKRRLLGLSLPPPLEKEGGTFLRGASAPLGGDSPIY